MNILANNKNAGGVLSASVVTSKAPPFLLTPPVSQIVISFPTVLFSDGKNQKNNRLLSLAFELMGNEPAYDSPTSKLTSGRAVPLTANTKFLVSDGVTENILRE